MLHPRSMKPLAAVLVAIALLVVALLFVVSGPSVAQVAPVPLATPISIRPPVANPPQITPSFPSPPPALQSVNLRGVPVLTIPNFMASSGRLSRAAKKALYESSMPAQNRGEQAAASGSPADVAADMDRTYAARNAETLAHRRVDGVGMLVRLRTAR